MNKRRARRVWALILNLVAPGVGLVILRREGLGIALAVLFAVFAQVALIGWMIAPASIPSILSVATGVAAGAVWLVSQWLAWKQARIMFGAQCERELRLLGESVTQAIDAERYAEARDLLNLATRIDDEDLALHLQAARLATRTGQFQTARKAWRRVMQLDKVGLYRTEALEMLRETRLRAQEVEEAQP